MSLNSILAIDVGGGTQDILIWRKGFTMENAVQLVLPSPTRVIAGRIAEATTQGKDIFLHGSLMGGGPMGKAVSRHLETGLRAYAQESPAASLCDDLASVKEMGVLITDQAPPEAVPIKTGDLFLEELAEALAPFGVGLPNNIAVAVCDHGYSPGYSNRKFRFEMWQDFLDGGGKLMDLIHREAPADMTRLGAIKEQAPEAFLMDTAAAAAWGALQDPEVAAMAESGVCILNLGNMHTVGFLLKDDTVLGIYEHHTGLLDPFMLADHMERFFLGELSNDEIFEGRGHGCACPAVEIAGGRPPIIVTGPRRALAEPLGWQVANPFGDVMLSGCFGLAAAALAISGGGSLRD